MGRAPIQHEVKCATKFRTALTVAFGKPPCAAVMVSGIVAWRRAFANPLDRAIPVRADRPAVLATLKCHDLAGQDTIAVEPCSGATFPRARSTEPTGQRTRAAPLHSACPPAALRHVHPGGCRRGQGRIPFPGSCYRYPHGPFGSRDPSSRQPFQRRDHRREGTLPGWHHEEWRTLSEKFGRFCRLAPHHRIPAAGLHSERPRHLDRWADRDSPIPARPSAPHSLPGTILTQARPMRRTASSTRAACGAGRMAARSIPMAATEWPGSAAGSGFD